MTSVAQEFMLSVLDEEISSSIPGRTNSAILSRVNFVALVLIVGTSDGGVLV